MDAISVIRTKRDGGRLSDEQIDWVIDAYTKGEVPDYQMASLLMAILQRGMANEEIVRWTNANIASGIRYDLSAVGRPTSDKHSTGGVGDKISLPLCPLVAACGVAVPQLSGRGLGHTGGTLDKMESIAGWSPDVQGDRYVEILRDIGCVICAAGADLAPSDKKLYALRDVTGTVESIPLISGSIMSKKIAEGTDALVLDVKFGSGAFMREFDKAKELAETMVRIGNASGVRTAALLTDMNTPLGYAVGNANEVAEAVEVLRGGGPADVVELTVALARVMVELSGISGAPDPGDVLADGAAYQKWDEMVRAQGGDPDAPLPVAKHVTVLEAPRDGVLTKLDAYDVAVAAWRLGAGRSKLTDPVQHAAGIMLKAKPGDTVTAGQPLLEYHFDEPDRLWGAQEALEMAIEIGDGPYEAPPLVVERID